MGHGHIHKPNSSGCVPVEEFNSIRQKYIEYKQRFINIQANLKAQCLNTELEIETIKDLYVEKIKDLENKIEIEGKSLRYQKDLVSELKTKESYYLEFMKNQQITIEKLENENKSYQDEQTMLKDNKEFKQQIKDLNEINDHLSSRLKISMIKKNELKIENKLLKKHLKEIQDQIKTQNVEFINLDESDEEEEILVYEVPLSN